MVTAVLDWRQALAEARTVAADVPNAVVVVTGSLYLVGAARTALRQREAT